MSVKAKAETNQQYHADTSHVSSSMLKALAKSPRIYEATYVTGEMAFKETPAMALGTAIHAYALEPDVFQAQYAVSPFSDKRKKDYKDWAKENAGKRLLDFSQAVVLDRCLKSLESIPLIKTVLEADGLVESSIRYEDSLSSAPCKVRTDKVIPDKRVVLDIKTISECSQKAIRYACEDFGYHIQDAHYRTGWATETGTDVDDWKMIFAFVETKEPFRSCACVLDWESQAEGMDLRQRLIGDWLVRRETGDWSEPGENEIKEITIPSLWRKKRNGE